MDNENINSILTDRRSTRIRLIYQGTLVGLATGLIIVLNRVAITKLSALFKNLYEISRGDILKVIGVFILLGLIGIFTGYLVRKEPMISGSGIPQVEGKLLRKLNMNWFRILVYKFIGGVMALAAGLSVGREGPSVQIGASIGEGVSKLFKKNPSKDEFLITSGASAGLTAAFNAPLSGVIFALEEVHRSFSPLVLIPAMAAALTADFITKQFLGFGPSLHFTDVTPLPLKYYWVLIILGIITGLSGVMFSKGILLFQNLYGKLKKLPIEIKVMIPFLITGVVGFLAPKLLGGGHEFIMTLIEDGYSPWMLLLIFIIKALLIFIAFGSGAPGGIFLPLLLLGAILGDVVGVTVSNMFNVPGIFIINFLIFGMAGNFASIVKAPITGIVLITEMTGSFEHLLALAIVVMISYITSDLLKSDPIYESLLERLLRKSGIVLHEEDENKILLEMVVEMGSEAHGKLIKDITWPKECLLVAIKRGNKEIIPRGYIKVLSGDYIVVLVSESKAAATKDKIKKITLIKNAYKVETENK
ncbi:ClC family H(+)/Cl(-) exchange transporter [Clostridium carnis]